MDLVVERGLKKIFTFNNAYVKGISCKNQILGHATNIVVRQKFKPCIFNENIDDTNS